MQRELLIVGLDPGTTLAYALLDLDGNILNVKSSKQLGIKTVSLEIAKIGRPVIVASDVSPAPNSVKKFASAFGAKLIFPEENMTIKEKNYITKGYGLENKHEKDALASAIFAFKKVRIMLNKIDLRCSQTETEFQADEIKRLLLTENRWNIDRAIHATNISMADFGLRRI